MKTGIIILGIARGGTSLIADLVRRWGAYAGPEADLQSPDHWNPAGYWEYQPLKRLNDELLASVGASERIPPTEPALLEAKAADPYFRQQATSLLENMQSNSETWFWKDPRLSMLLPFWKKQWQSVISIVVIRQPLDTIQSQRAIVSSVLDPQYVPISAVLLHWQAIMIALLQQIDQQPRTLFVEYERLLQHPAEECSRLCAFLDQESHCSSDPAPRLASMTPAINVKLRHQSSAHSILDEPMATQEQKALYRFLKRKIEDPALPFNAADFPLYVGWREYLQVMERLVHLALAKAGAQAFDGPMPAWKKRLAEQDTPPS